MKSTQKYWDLSRSEAKNNRQKQKRRLNYCSEGRRL